MGSMKARELAGEAEYFERPRSEMLPYIPAGAKTILEIGCGKGSFGRLLKSRQPVHYTGIEFDPEAAKAAATVLDEVRVGGCEAHIHALPKGAFDCIILNDVLEHLPDPWAVLTGLRPLLSRQGTLVASIPNFRHHRTFWRLVWNGEWKYGTHGILDRTHIRFFTRESMIRMFRDSGYSIESMAGINGRSAWQWFALNLFLLGRAWDTRYLQYAVVATAPERP